MWQFLFSFFLKNIYFSTNSKKAKKKQTHNNKWIDFVFNFYSVERSFSWENYIWLAGASCWPKSRDVKKNMVWLRFCWDFFFHFSLFGKKHNFTYKIETLLALLYIIFFLNLFIYFLMNLDTRKYKYQIYSIYIYYIQLEYPYIRTLG